MTNGWKINDYEGVGKVMKAISLLITVNTTAYTASEMLILQLLLIQRDMSKRQLLTFLSHLK